MLQTALVVTAFLTLFSLGLQAFTFREFRKLTRMRTDLLRHFGGSERRVRFGGKLISMLYLVATIVLSASAFFYSLLLFD
jgi:hypothetical protein